MQKEQLSQIYADHHEKGRRYNYLFCNGERGHYLRRWIGTGKTVLDLGCRDGMLTQFFSNGNVVTGVDIDRKALDLIQKRLQLQAFWLDLNDEWPFSPESFDVIVACEVLEHLFFLPKILDQIRATLKKGGMFIGSVPNSFRMRNRLKFLFGQEFDQDPTHVRLFSYQKIERMLSRRFCEVEVIPLQGKIAPFLPVSTAYPKALTRLFAKDLLWNSRPLSSFVGNA